MRALIVLLATCAGYLSVNADTSVDVADIDVSDRYIITLQQGASLNQHVEHIQDLHTRAENGSGYEGITHRFDLLSTPAYAGHFPPSVIASLSNNSDILLIEPDAVFTAASLIEEKRVTYGLDQISHRTPTTGRFLTYAYDSSAASGTYAYILDSGVNCDHRDLRGRCTLGYNAVPNVPFTDPGGHGTHVAGIIGGTLYGVAKKTNLVAVKVMHRTHTTGANMLAGYQWAVNDIVTKKRQAVAVINVSVTGPVVKALNDAVDAAAAKGVSTVCAAGNEGAAAKGSSPGSAKGCITVGACDKAKKRAPTSNYGPEVALFAPGVGIKSDYAGSELATTELSGTSQAAGFVAGLVVYQKKLQKLATASVTRKVILSLCSKGLVQDPKGSANLFAYNGSGK